MTHSQKIGGGAHGYIRTRYLAKCEAMQAFDLRLREHGEVVALPAPWVTRLTAPLTRAAAALYLRRIAGARWRKGGDSNPHDRHDTAVIAGRFGRRGLGGNPRETSTMRVVVARG